MDLESAETIRASIQQLDAVLQARLKDTQNIGQSLIASFFGNLSLFLNRLDGVTVTGKPITITVPAITIGLSVPKEK